MVYNILSPSDGTPRGEAVPMTSERALAEFRAACFIWLKHMTPEDRRAAADHLASVMETA